MALVGMPDYDILLRKMGPRWTRSTSCVTRPDLMLNRRAPGPISHDTTLNRPPLFVVENQQNVFSQGGEMTPILIPIRYQDNVRYRTLADCRIYTTSVAELLRIIMIELGLTTNFCAIKEPALTLLTREPTSISWPVNHNQYKTEKKLLCVHNRML